MFYELKFAQAFLKCSSILSSLLKGSQLALTTALLANIILRLSGTVAQPYIIAKLQDNYSANI